ncbi:hypothetical protein [Flagellimonas sp.]|uniref:hypothetical protein n=1 Tax=Flagellimonas sp. TaxID=2058762 RepID=UPI003BAB7ECD
METKQLEFRPFGNLGIQMTPAVIRLCNHYINKGDVAELLLRCKELAEEDDELFILILPFHEKLHIRICDTKYDRLASYAAINSKGMIREVNFFLKGDKMMFVQEMIHHAF